MIPTLDQRLKEVLEAGYTQADLGRASGVSKGTVSQWLNGSIKSMKLEYAQGISTLTGFAAGWLVTGKGEKKSAAPIKKTTHFEIEVEDAPDIVGALKRIPVVGRVQAGPDGLLHIDDYPDSPDGYMLWWSSCDEAYALRIRGESMSPRYRPGEFVGVDPCADVHPSDEVIVFLADGKRMIKRLLWQRDGQACFESVNQSFQNIILDMDELDKMHLVLGHIPKAAFRPAIQ